MSATKAALLSRAARWLLTAQTMLAEAVMLALDHSHSEAEVEHKEEAAKMAFRAALDAALDAREATKAIEKKT